MALRTARKLRTALLGPVALLFAGVLVPVGFLPTPGHAQSIVRGEIQGMVSEVEFEGLDGAQIVLTEQRTQTEILTASDNGGFFRVPFLPPGEYEVLVEDLGFVPRLVSGVTVRPGQVVRLGIELRPAPPPVEVVDSTAAVDAVRGRFDGLGSRWISRNEIRAFSDPTSNLARLVSLSPTTDGALGSEGLPGASSSVVLDGVLFTPARHPSQDGWTSGPLLPRIGLASIDVHSRPDVEWFGGTGSTVAAVSRTASAERAVEVGGSGSAGPLWQSEGFSELEAPSATSIWGEGAIHLPIQDDRATLFLGVEGLRLESPRPSPIPGDVADRLADVSGGLGADDAEALGAPWSAITQTVSAVGRLDWRTQGSAEVAIRAGLSSLRSEGNEFFSDPLTYGSVGSFTGTDIFLSASTLAELRPSVVLELRAGVERSERTWGGTGGPEVSTLSPTQLTDGGVTFGPSPGLEGTVSRSAVLFTGSTHFRWPENSLKLGLSLNAPFHDYEYAFGSSGTYVLSSAESLLTDDGVFRQSRGNVRTSSFRTPEVGAFLQHLWEPEPGFRISTGLRFDYEFLPDQEAPLNGPWLVQSGLSNNRFEPDLRKFSPRLGVSWDLSGNGETVLEAAFAATYDQLDPADIAEVFALSGAVSDYRQLGGVDAWPGPPSGSGQTSDTGVSITMFGPGLEAPRTARGTLGITQRAGDDVGLYLSGTFRRTEFLTRRAQLNLTLAPSGTLSDDRAVYGDLAKAGGLVVSDPGSSHRFSDFGDVWALNADGWSEYLGVTAAVEIQASEVIGLFASYTGSSTEDNLVGARTGTPEAQIAPHLGVAFPDDWTEGTSDYDVPHRFVAGVRASLDLLEGVEVAGLYRYRSGRPYTPGFRHGVDVNADGSGYNDPASVPSDLSAVEADIACLGPDVGRIVSRNACRAEGTHTIDIHLAVGLFPVGGSVAELTVDAFNLMDSDIGSPDTALLLVEEGATLTQNGSRTTIPTRVNPNFGQTLDSLRPGRLVRVGLRVGLP